MAQAAGKKPTDWQLGLNDADYARLRTFLPEIAADLLPGARVRRLDGETRIGSKGSLSVKDDGRWYSFEAMEGGVGPALLLRFLMPDVDEGRRRGYAAKWLRDHPGTGGSTGDRPSDDDAARAARNAAFARQVLDTMLPVEGTPAETYLRSRGLVGPWPPNLLGYWPDPDRPGEGALIGVISDSKGTPIGVQLGYLTHDGHKREAGGATRRHFYLTDPKTPDAAFHLPPQDPDPDPLSSTPLLVLVVEGLEDALSLARTYPKAEIVGLPGIGAMQRMRYSLRGISITVFRDGDAPDTPAARTLERGIDHLLNCDAKVKVTATPEGEDANSLLQSGGIAALQALVDAAAPAELSPHGVIAYAAGLAEVTFKSRRKELAKRAKMRVKEFEEYVEKERKRRAEENPEPEPPDPGVDPDPVSDIAMVLDTARAELAEYIVAPPEQLDMVVMWGLHTHFVHHATIDIAISPRLKISAPMPVSGKTTLLEAVSNFSHRSVVITSTSAAAFYRLNDAQKPTLLIDEMQGLLGSKNQDSEREAILLSSHRRRTAINQRVEKVGDNFVVVDYDAWCTFAFTVSGTARLSLAWNSRCLHVTMRRALAGEVKQHLTLGISPVLVDCGRKFARWASDQQSLPEVKVPPNLLNRDGDNWRPLLAIAELVGGHWPEKMLAAAGAGMRLAPSTDLLIALLTDAVRVLGEREEVPTLELLETIKSIHDPSWDWDNCNRGRGLNEYFLRDTLKDVLLPPGSQRMKGKRDTRGYTKAQFEDAVRRYLKPEDLSADDNPSATAAPGSTARGSGNGAKRKRSAAKRGAQPRKARGKPATHPTEPPSPEPAPPPASETAAEGVDETW